MSTIRVDMTVDAAVLLRDMLARQTITIGDPNAAAIAALAVAALESLNNALEQQYDQDPQP